MQTARCTTINMCNFIAFYIQVRCRLHENVVYTILNKVFLILCVLKSVF